MVIIHIPRESLPISLTNLNVNILLIPMSIPKSLPPLPMTGPILAGPSILDPILNPILAKSPSQRIHKLRPTPCINVLQRRDHEEASDCQSEEESH